MKLLRVYFPVLILLLTSLNVRANHLLGGEISYKLVSSAGNTSIYRVTLSFFADCSSNTPGGAYQALVGADPEITLLNGTTFSARKRLQYDVAQSNIEITPVCPDEANNTACIDPNNPLPGIKKFVYSAEFSLLSRSSQWRFAFYGSVSTSPTTSAGRSAIIQNAEVNAGTGASGSIMYLEATLNNSLSDNNSPVFTSVPTPFFCLNKAANYTLGASDADNDSLNFKLIPAKEVDSNVVPLLYSDITYIPPFTATAPLPTATGNFNYSNISGQMSFTPNEVRNCLVTNLVEEYRDGVLVGSSMREMTFVILDNCNNDAPLTPINNITHATVNYDAAGNLLLSVCEGQTQNITFDINSQDPNNDNVTVTYDNFPAGATITIDSNGTPHPVIHFTWNLMDASPGNYLFYITYADDGCPLASRKTLTYTITVVPHPNKFLTGSQNPCINQTNGKVWVIPDFTTPVSYNYRWVDDTPTELQNVNSLVGDTLRNLGAGYYKVYIRNEEGCGTNKEFTLTESEAAKAQLRSDTIVCEGIPIDLSSLLTEDNTSYSWNTGDTGCCITASTTGNYILYATNHCGSSADSVYLEFVKCNYCLFVPNAFSPNADGKNDVFNIIPACIISKYQLQIFNRWGQLVFTSLNLNNSWDGTYKGKPADAGAYFYVIQATPTDLTKGNVELKGDVTLIR